jgi:acetoin utilization deacetylase AcuC-like enzyme
MTADAPRLTVFTHPSCSRHDPVPGHPEQPARLAAVMSAFESPAFAQVPVRQAPRANRAQLERVHAIDHVERVYAAGAGDRPVQLDPDTAMAPSSLDAALFAAGAGVAAVDLVMSTPGQRAFCAVRPPGHHATATTAMGFCLFNNIAVAAAHALAEHGLDRVAIVDFDVHHGNGSQAIFWTHPRVMVASSHQWPLYPGSGRSDESGASDNIVNAPLPAGSGSEEFRHAWRELILPRIAGFKPQLLLISAGFDGHRADPLAGLNLVEDDFAWLTRELVAIAGQHAQGRIVSMLEGGYDLDALTACTRAHALALLA